MTPVNQFLVLLTPEAFVTAIVSGVAFGLVVKNLRPTADTRITTFFAVVMAVIWYAGQFAPLYFLDGTGWGTLSRMSLFLVGFVVPMWLKMRWRDRR